MEKHESLPSSLFLQKKMHTPACLIVSSEKNVHAFLRNSRSLHDSSWSLCNVILWGPWLIQQLFLSSQPTCSAAGTLQSADPADMAKPTTPGQLDRLMDVQALRRCRQDCRKYESSAAVNCNRQVHSHYHICYQTERRALAVFDLNIVLPHHPCSALL